MNKDTVLFGLFFILCNSFKSSKSKSILSSFDLDCETWKNEHIFLAKDLHFYNLTFPFIKIDNLKDLNISTNCQATEYKINSLNIFGKKNLLIDNDLSLDGILNIINRTNIQINVLFQNVNGFNENDHPKRGEKLILNTVTSKLFVFSGEKDI